MNNDQRLAIKRHDLPLPIIDEESGRPYMLVPVRLTAGSLNRVRADVPGIMAMGQGDSAAEALDYLTQLLRLHFENEAGAR